MRIFGLILIFVLMALPIFWLRDLINNKDLSALFSQYLGLVALIAMALGQTISTRWSLVETIFGPLDQSYRIHKWLGIGALVAVLIHDTIDADMVGLGVETGLTDTAETAGEISLYGLLIFIFITIATFIPYNLWKFTHRFIGLFFLLGVFHYFFILKPFGNFDPLGIYMAIICGIGTAAYLYTSAPRGFRPFRNYTVREITKQGNALAIDMAPDGRPIKHHAGQFAFFSFVDAGMGEPHPFTISSAPREDGSLRITVAPLGDYTSRLMGRAKVGQSLRVEGPFGHFNKARKGSEVWIAAGVGITPFVALSEALAANQKKVTLIYSVSDRSNAAHLEILESISGQNKNFTLVLWDSREMGRLTAEKIADLVGESLKQATVSFCGPSSMRKTLQQELKGYGVSPRRFRFENFEIRTGLGFRKLAEWLWDRRRTVSRKSP